MNRVVESRAITNQDNSECYGILEYGATASQLNSTIDEINKIEFRLKVLEDNLRWKNWRWR